ncbi:SH3 and multiple ankyrin repeat domains protein 3-like, partial [Limulus polyphemus]|uniref:SH3 and multiple ankyrin repeat domains protein 3-like n=1 Tax=Limulus polyphemus TaxID=6850 RepID=A0ABM1T6T9_LIMPO
MKAVAMETADGSGSQTNEDIVSVRVFVPELQLEKFFQFNVEELVWDVKQHILSSLPKELKESFNYGIFILPRNGKAGKFLDEERLLLDYPLSEPVEYLELRYKRRVYKTMNVDEKQIKQLHTRANLRRMIDYINCGNVDKINKLCTKGLDPNFHCPESGETSLTLATALPQPAKVLMELVNGGAHLDFRMKDGRTAIHRAVERDNFEALKSLLDLGSSPNYKDNRGLTALYYSVFYGCDPKLTELLLHDHAIFGIADHQGWQEVHQACKHGLVQHLENLLFYGADINSRNASGNTPLHVCAVNDQESCARVLLFRGADKNALNYANQNPYQVAVIAGNHHMAELIEKHRPEDVVPYREAPQYNLRRRASAAVAAMSRNNSDPRLELALGFKPPSPCPSYRSLPPFSSVSTISEASTGSSSTCTQPSGEDSEDTASASVVTEKSVTSDSSGVCTSNSGTSESTTEHGDNPILPGTTCVCVEDYSPCSPGHLQLTRGDIVDVVGISDCGLLEGRLRNEQEGLFPSSAVQEVKLRKIEALPPTGQPRIEGRRELNARKTNTIPRQWKMYGDARTVILHKGKKGFGFVLRGAQATSPLMERQPTDNWPSLQYLDDVDKGGMADLAGLKKGDFLLEVSNRKLALILCAQNILFLFKVKK